MDKRSALTSLAAVIAIVVSLASHADGNGTWTGGGVTTDWSDAGNWLYGSYPSSLSRAIFFKDAYQTSAALLTATQEVCCMYVQLDEHVGSQGNASLPDPLPVTLRYPMRLTLSTATDVALNIALGRRMELDGAVVVDCGGIYARGELVMRNGASLTATNASRECKFEFPGAGMHVDGSEINLYTLRTIRDDSLRFTVRGGGFFRFDRLLGSVGVPAEWNADVTDAVIWSPFNSPVYNAGLVPSRSGSLVVRHNAFTPDVAAGDTLRWGADVYITNHVDGALTLTNRTTIYGGGRLFAGALTFTQAHATQVVDIAEINLGKTINFSGWGHTTCYEFVGDTRFGGFGNWRSSEAADDLYWMIFRGNTVFDTLDCFDKTTRRTFWMKRMFLQPRSSLAYVGGGEVTNLVSELPAVLSSLSVGDDTRAVFAELPSAKRLDVHDLALASGSVLYIPSIVNSLNVLGNASIDPTARIRIVLPSALESKLYPLYTSLGRSVPTGSLDLGELPDGWVVKTVAGTAYLTDGRQTYEEWDVWTGASSGLWSDAKNWILTPPKTSDRSARFYGESNTVVTNDVDGVEVFQLRTETRSAPFVLTGKPIALTSTGTGDKSTIYHLSQFPFVVETPLSSTGEIFNISAGVSAPVVLRGGLDAPQAKLSVAGAVVADADVSVRQFGFLATAGKTVFTVRNGANVTVAGQSVPVDGSGEIYIGAGGVMTVGGNLSFAVENEHRIDGLLDVTGEIALTAKQGFFGTGVVQVASSRAVNAAAALRIGEGVTLKAKTWGSLPVDVVSSATIAAADDFSYEVAGGLMVSGLGAKLTFDTDVYGVSIATQVCGRDFDIVKKGSGRLSLECPNVVPGHVTVESGALSWKDDQSFGRLVVRPGAVLKFGSRGGTVGKLILKDSVDLSGVTIAAADDIARSLAQKSAQEIIRVGELCEIKGLPAAPKGYKLTVTQTAEGGRALKVKIMPGLIIFVK